MPLDHVMRVIENNDPVFTVTVTKDDEVFDITGCTFDFLVKNSPSADDVDALITYSNGTGVTLSDPSAGIAQIIFERDDLPAPGRYWYTLTINLTDARKETIEYGPFIVNDV